MFVCHVSLFMFGLYGDPEEPWISASPMVFQYHTMMYKLSVIGWLGQDYSVWRSRSADLLHDQKDERKKGGQKKVSSYTSGEHEHESKMMGC